MTRHLNRLFLAFAFVAALLVMSLPLMAQDATPTAIPTPEPTLEPPPNCPAFEGQPEDQRVAYYMGEGSAYMEAGRISEATLAFTCVIRVIDANYVPAYMGRGEIYIRTRELERAIADFTRASQLEPGLAAAANNRGVAYALQSDEERAVADFDRALSIDSGFMPAINNRALMHAIAGDYDAAVTLVSNAIDNSGIDATLAEIRNPDRPDDAPAMTVPTEQARLYGLLGTVRSAQALAEYRSYLDLVTYSGAFVDERIAAAASALESRFTFDFRLDDGSLLQISPFLQNR